MGSYSGQLLFPTSGLTPDETKHVIRQRIQSDGEPAFNLAGFHTTYMEPEIEDIILENLVRKRRTINDTSINL